MQMKYILFLLLIFNILNIIPLWDFNASTIDLLSRNFTHTYEICSKKIFTLNIKLVKTITKTENSIIEKNSIYINGSFISDTNWEDLESIYYLNSTIYICPKGRNHMNHMNIYHNFTFSEIKPYNFSYDDNWELKCYYQLDKNYMFVGYLNKYETLFVYKFNSNTWYRGSVNNIYSGLFDFKWTTEVNNDREYPMKMIIYDGKNIILKGTIFTIENDNINRNDIFSNNLIETLNYSNAYFDFVNDYCYFITYNKNPPDFKSGYFTEATSFEYTEISSLEININTTSPLQFYDNFTIESMTFNRNNRYVLYKIYNTIKEKNYYGIIDVVLNKVIFNTDEVINSFKPYSNNSFLAITNNSAYKICALSDENKKCISSCSSGKNIYIDSQRPNFCGTECSNYLMVPTGICVDECDENIFHIHGKFCGFCKDINSTHPYKLLNETGCYDTIPEGTYLYNSKYNLLKRQIISTIPDTLINSTLDNFSTLISDNNEYQIHIIQTKTNLMKEEIIENIDYLMNEINTGKIYEIFGNDYNIKICPINSKEYRNISTYIDFLTCEEKLKASNSLPEDSILTIFQIEIYQNNSYSLINQLEYMVFDEDWNELDLSVCSEDDILIHYSIANSSLLNIPIYSKYSYIGVDILNINDNFFNDICYPYSEGDSDMILEDRINDIYQNYSVCDSNCNYQNIDLENMTITCSCNVKTEITIELQEPTFNKIFLGIFQDSTFSVVKCYKLVLNFNKKKNVGFYMFLSFILLHIPFIINYIIFKDTQIKKYIREEMVKFHYLKNIKNPQKKKRLIKKNNLINTTNNKSVQSGNVIYQNKDKIKKIKKSNKNLINKKFEENVF